MLSPALLIKQGHSVCILTLASDLYKGFAFIRSLNVQVDGGFCHTSAQLTPKVMKVAAACHQSYQMTDWFAVGSCNIPVQ